MAVVCGGRISFSIMLERAAAMVFDPLPSVDSDCLDAEQFRFFGGEVSISSADGDVSRDFLAST